MFWLELQSAWDWLAVSWEATIEAERAFVSTISNERVDEQEVRLAGGDEVTAISGDIHSDDRITKSRQSSLKVCVGLWVNTCQLCRLRNASHLGILADLVKKPDVTFVARKGHLARLSGSSGREVVLGGVLLELGLHELVSLQAGVDAEETVMGWRSATVSQSTWRMGLTLPRVYSQCPINV